MTYFLKDIMWMMIGIGLPILGALLGIAFVNWVFADPKEDSND